MMLLTCDYSVVVYSTHKCVICTPTDAEEVLNEYVSNNDASPDVDQLKTIQKAALLTCDSLQSRLVILVPDNWISVSDHPIDHIIPSSLLPLAALSYAVETTFAPPDSLLLSYQQEALPSKQARLTVFACSCSWAKQLYSPFEPQAKSYLVMTFGQWRDGSSRVSSWSQCSKRALSRYEPDREKRQKNNRLWLVLGVLTVFIHGLGYGYYVLLQQRVEALRESRQGVIDAQTSWLSSNEPGSFVLSGLSLIQALPKSARLTLFESGKEKGAARQIFFQMTVPKQDLDSLLIHWRKQYPDWRWEVKDITQKVSTMLPKQEVVDVSISVSED